MYEAYFGFSEGPFSIAPNPRFLFMSSKHREAMAHLLFGMREGGGFVQLTGEVGTGKTTLCRQLLSELPADVDVALILNPRIDDLELMQSICDELRIVYANTPTIKTLLDALNSYLLDAHARGRNTVLIIDEAQNLSASVLEQIRLLTNLETARKKLLQVILIGQGELKATLAQRSLRQLSQRVTARYHLLPLDRQEVGEYIRFRLKQAGCETNLFTDAAIRRIHASSKGVPRLVNVMCDRALLGAYANGRRRVTRSIASRAGIELRGESATRWLPYIGWAVATLLILAAPVAAYTFSWLPERVEREVRQIMPSWVPRVGDAAVSRGAQGMLPWPLREAHAAEPMPRMDPSLELSAPSRRATLAPRRPTPVSIARLDRLDRDGAVQRLTAMPGESAGRITALRDLAGVWELTDSQVLDCVGVSEFGLSCLGPVSDWDQLKKLDRPAVVELGIAGSPPGFAVLRYVIADAVVLRIAGGDFSMDVTDFLELWHPRAVIFWRRPPLGSIPVNERSNREDVLWLRRALNLEAANHGGVTLSRVERADFDAELLASLHDFQRRNRLDIRNLAGETEFVLLNSRLSYEFHPTLVY